MRFQAVPRSWQAEGRKPSLIQRLLDRLDDFRRFHVVHGSVKDVATYPEVL